MAVHHWSKSTGYALSQTEKLFLWIEGPTKSKNSMLYPNKWLISLDLVTLDQGWMWLNCFFLAANRSMLREDSHSILVDASSGRLRLITSVQALIKYIQNLCLFLSAFNLTGTTTRSSFDETVTRVQHYYAFREEASLKVQGIKGSTSQTQGSDGTLSATTLNSVKMILEGLTRLRTKVMELRSIQTSFNT